MGFDSTKEINEASEGTMIKLLTSRHIKKIEDLTQTARSPNQTTQVPTGIQ